MMVAGCDDGRFGVNCQENCSCQNGGTCHPVTGHCTCPTGWIGPRCSQTCPEGHFGSSCMEICNCTGGGSCDPRTGICSCPPGHMAPKCENGKIMLLLYIKISLS